MREAASALGLGYRLLADQGDPYLHFIGPFYERHEPDGGFSYACEVRPAHANMAGNAHGGMLMSFVDMVMAQPAYMAQGKDQVTAVSTVASFIAPVRIGDLVECRPDVLRKTGDVLFVAGVFRVADICVLSAQSLWKLAPGMASR